MALWTVRTDATSRCETVSQQAALGIQDADTYNQLLDLMIASEEQGQVPGISSKLEKEFLGKLEEYHSELNSTGKFSGTLKELQAQVAADARKRQELQDINRKERVLREQRMRTQEDNTLWEFKKIDTSNIWAQGKPDDMAFSPDGKFLVFTNDTQVGIVSLEEREKPWVGTPLKLNSKIANNWRGKIQFSPGGEYFSVASHSNLELSFYALTTLQERVITPPQPNRLMARPSFNANGNQILVTGEDGLAAIHTTDEHTREPLIIDTSEAHRKLRIDHGRFIEEENMIVLAGHGLNFSYVPLNELPLKAIPVKLFNESSNDPDYFQSLDYFAPTKQLVLGASNGSALLVDLHKKKFSVRKIETRHVHKNSISVSKFSHSGERILLVGPDGQASLTQVSDPKLLAKPIQSSSQFFSTALFSPDDKWCLLGTHSNEAYLIRTDDPDLKPYPLDLPSGNPPAPGNGFYSVTFSPNGKHIAISRALQEFGLWHFGYVRQSSGIPEP